MSFLTRLSLANRLVVALMSLAVIAFGLFGVSALRQELIPSLETPQATVAAFYRGATPDIVAQDVTEPLEDALTGVKGVTKVRSTSSTGTSQISVEWEYGDEGDEILADIKSAVDSVTPTLPDDVDPEVIQASTDDIPAIVVSASADLPLRELSPIVDDIAVKKIGDVEGVRLVRLGGQDTTRVDIKLDNERLRRYDITAATVTQSVTAQLQTIPAGNSYNDTSQLTVEVGSAPDTLAQIRKLPIATPEDDSVRLEKMATVKEVSIERTSIARANQQPALSLEILKTSDADSVEVSHAVRALFPELERQIGNGAEIEVVFDQSTLIEESLDGLATEGALGLIFAVLVILAFLLSLRATIVTAISIPLSLLIAMIGLWVGDFSLNLLTLAALTVAVGRVVDDSIVVIENIKRRAAHTRRLAMGDIIAAVQEVGGAVTASTLTTVVVFLPIGLVGGQSGELFRPFALTVAIALGASLLVALTIIPLLAFWIMRGPRGAGDRAESVDDSERVTPIQRGYLPILRSALRHPLIALSLAVLILVATVGALQFVKTDFIGSSGDDRALLITQTLPPGTKLDNTSEAAKQVEQALSDNPDVETYLAGIGQASNPEAAGEPNIVNYSITLKESTEPDVATQNLRDQLDELSNAGDLIVRPSSEGWQSNDLTVTVVGTDDEEMRAAAAAIQEKIEQVPNLINIETDVSDQRPLLRVKLNRDKAADLGFTQQDIGQAVAAALQGQKVGSVTLNTDDDSLDVYVRTSTNGLSPKQVGMLKLPVSQLQQTKAINAATDRLKEKSDALKDANDELSDQQDVLEDLQEDLTDEQDALSDDQDAVADDQEDLADKQKAKAERDQDKADREFVEDIRDAREDMDDAEDDVDDAESVPAEPDPSDLPPPGVPAGARELAIQQYKQARAAGIQAAKGQVEAAEAQMEALEDALDDFRDQRRDQTKQQDDQEELGDRAKDIGDKQKAVGDEQSELGDQAKAIGDLQKDIGDKQSDLADEQEDIQDIRAGQIRLKSIASIKVENAPTTVRHNDGDKAITVKGTPVPDSDLTQVGNDFNAAVASVQLPESISLDTGGALEEQQKANRQLVLAMLAAIVLVFIIMVATFKSLWQPLILLPAIPFAATGAILGLLVTNVALGVPAMIGLLMLIGIVVTNAIVLIDLINNYRKRGEDSLTAIVDGARLRLRPIIMTAAATIFALLPMGLGLTGGGLFISRPLAVVVIGGLVSSTMLTLIIVPILYGLVTRSIGKRARQRWQHTQLPVSVGGPAGDAAAADADATPPTSQRPAAEQSAPTNAPAQADEDGPSPWQRPEDDRPTTIR